MNWKLQLGANVQNDGVDFRVWAPKADKVEVKIENELFPMNSVEQGYYTCFVKNAKAGSQYTYILNSEKERPDPVSRFQPQGVHKASQIVNPADFKWSDHNWTGIKLNDYIIYELHVGTFTPAGTFEAVIERLGYLKELGITAIELMPIVEFPGKRNWGYDGAYLYAPHSAYGGPLGLKKLIDACHQREIAVILDVVYNHLGPEGNYLNDFGYYFTDRYKTLWGSAINFDGPFSDPVREYFIDNALYWLTEFHLDALRLDAVHAIYDFSAKHILRELKEKVKETKKSAHIFAESDLNDVRVINPENIGGHGIDSQWNDDFHHALHAFFTDKRNSYFKDFGSLQDIRKALKDGFVFDGKWSEYRKKIFGSSSVERPGDQFVVFLQNHDQISNASEGKRLSTLIDLEKFKVASMILFCAPNIPLIFMGQEWASESPFFYFTSHENQELIENIRESYFKEHRLRGLEMEIHDPQAEKTFLNSKMNWSEIDEAAHKDILDFYKTLIRYRKSLPSLNNCDKEKTEVVIVKSTFILRRYDSSGDEILMICNLSNDEWTVPSELLDETWKLIVSTRRPSPEKIPGWTGLLYQRRLR